MSALRFFRTFVAVARYGSFSEAAEHMALTQAGVSFQMRALEELLNRRLFEREGRQSVITPEGRELLPEVLALLEQYDRICAPRGPALDAPGAVSFGSIVSCMVPLSRSISTLKRLYPTTDVRLYAGKSGELAALVAKKDLDAALVVEHPRLRSDLRWVPICHEPLVVITSIVVRARNAIDALSTMPFLRFDRKEHTGKLVDKALAKLGCPINEFLELNSMETLIELVRQNAGVTLLPLPAHANWVNDRSLRVIPLPEHVNRVQRKLGIVMRHDYAYPGFGKNFISSCNSLFNFSGVG